MLSIIICSRTKTIRNTLSENIKNTIGCDYELIVIDNSENKYSIFEAYNLGVSRAKYPYLCFMHEDILFHTEDWGKKVIEHFRNPKVGIIGVAGSHYLPKLPGSHWSPGISSSNIIHTIGGKTNTELFRYICNKETSVQAVLLDGLWLCIPETVIRNVSFDDTTFSGFHCYDSDICLQIKKLNYDANIVFDIDIEHFSLGKRDSTWLYNIFCLYNKWKNELPIYSIKLSKSEITQANFSNAKELIEQLKINKYSFIYIYKTWLYYLRCNPITSKKHLLLVFRLVNERLYFSLIRFIKTRT